MNGHMRRSWVGIMIVPAFAQAYKHKDSVYCRQPKKQGRCPRRTILRQLQRR